MEVPRDTMDTLEVEMAVGTAEDLVSLISVLVITEAGS
jgi:hypothetical protein